MLPLRNRTAGKFPIFRRRTRHVFWLALLVAGAIGSLDAQTTPSPDAPPAGAPSLEPAGFATVKAYGVDKLAGGGGGEVVEVRTAQEFRDALERRDIKKKADQHQRPRIVKVMADIDLGELANEQGGEVLKNVGKVEVRSHTTLFAPGEGATIRRGGLDVHGACDVIIRNLKFRDLWEEDPTGQYDRFGWDYIRITSAGKSGLSHHVWIDHCDFGKCYDGQIDITHGSDLVTVSWCRFSGDERGPHKKSMLIGHSSSPSAVAVDRGKLNVTLHHNLWENVADRAPRVRCGNIHAFNNFIDGAENATISVTGAVTLVENSVYQDTRVATTFSHAKDAVSRQLGGTICLVESRNDHPRPPQPASGVPAEESDEPAAPAVAPKAGASKQSQPNPDLAFEVAHNFLSSVERGALQFNAPSQWEWADRNRLPYAYRLDPTQDVPALVSRLAGVGRLPATAFSQSQ